MSTLRGAVQNISLLLALILIPSIVNATNDILEINLNNNITIEKVMLEKGEQFNKDIRTLAGDSNPTIDTRNTSIKAIKVVNTLPNNVETIDVAEAKDESIKVYYDNGTIYLYTTLSKVILNKSSSQIDTKNFDTSNVTNMNDMFGGCSSLTSLDVSNFDTSNVTSMGGMFYNCSSLTSLDVSNFDTSKVTDMSRMFYDCSSLTSLDVSNFDTSKVTSMSDMFGGCESLTSLDVSKFDTSKVTNMSYMFIYCKFLTSLDLSNFDTSKVTEMGGMFSDCSSLTSLDLSNFDTSKVTNMSSMFYKCSSVTSLDVSNFDTSKVTYMYMMFQDCSKLKTIYASNKFNTLKVSGSGAMFYNCISLVGGAGTTYNSNYTDKTYARIDSSSTPGYFTSKA